MRLLILALCVLVAVSVFAIMLLSLWSSRRGEPSARQGLVAELVWAAIPCVMIVAAAIPAVTAVATSSPGESAAAPASVRDAELLDPEPPTSMQPRSLGDPLSIHTRRGDS